MKRVGRMAWKSLLYFITLSFIALMIGLAVANMINPGLGVPITSSNENRTDTSQISLQSELHKIFQPSFFQAAVGFSETGKPSGNGGEILAIVLMAVIFSLAIMSTKGTAKNYMLEFNHSLSEIMFTTVNLVMLFSPFGILY
jgi:proton glutamate symport protein